MTLISLRRMFLAGIFQGVIDLAKKTGNRQMILHTTKTMEIAWGMYEGLGFKRSEDLDFLQGELPVFGFRLELA